MATEAPEVELIDIGKRFPGVVANHDVDVTIRPGTVHALVGENGAGKSTLMKILYGVQRPDEGTIRIGGTEVDMKSPDRRHRARRRHGVPALHARRQPHRAREHGPRSREAARHRRRRASRDRPHLRPVRVRPRARRPRREAGRRRPPATRDRQGPVPRRPHHHPRRAHRRARAAGGRRLVRQPPRAQGRRQLGAVHQPQARRGAGHRRRHHGHAPRNHGRHCRSVDGHQARSSPR